MPLIIFDAISATCPPCEVNSPKGGKLVDICDASDAIIPFSCRSASCGTCRVDVSEGADLLEPPRDEELDVLDVFGDDPAKRRLACQARVRAGEGRVRVRPVDV
jgi:ferredoxin